MEEPPTIPEASREVMPPMAIEPLSATDKFVGIISEPSATYEHISAVGARVSDWVLPVIIMSLVLGLALYVRFSNPDLAAEMMAQQEIALQKQVEAGNLTSEQAARAKEQAQQLGGLTKLLMPIGAMIGYVFVFFFTALLYWLLVRFIMRGDITYTTVLSVIGLAAYISVIDQLISMLLMLLTGKVWANLSPALFMTGDITSMTFRLMLVFAPITLWATYVMGIGFEKTAGISRLKGLASAFLVWMLFSSLSVFGGFGM